MRSFLIVFLLAFSLSLQAQINTERVMIIARNALYFEDYVLSIQYFNQVINAKPYLYEPYFFRGLAKVNLDDYQGAESDCTEALNRNPFVVGAYQIRGIARIRQNNFDGAIEDYRSALKYDPENLTLWHNMSLCHINKEDYEAALDDLNQLLAISPRYSKAYLMRGDVRLKQKDTISAISDFDYAIKLDKYDSEGYSSRGIVRLQQSKYADAEKDFDQAIHLSARNANLYINRALARFHQKNLRGAMSDYDLALDIDPHNFLGHYNRGLLRSQVGDDNRAIEDFDYVLTVEPDNMMATFNRGVLRSQTGDYRGAIEDYSKVLHEYPNFELGYRYRSDARKKIGDKKGAEHDANMLTRMELDRLNRRHSGLMNNNKVDEEGQTEPKDSTAISSSAEKTRKKSDRNMNNYRKLVIADDSDPTTSYSNSFRGRIQNKNVAIKLEPMFALNYYERLSEVKRTVHYHKFVDELNYSKKLPRPLHITNMEAPLTENQAKFHFALIDTHSASLEEKNDNAMLRFIRGMDFYLVQDFTSAVDDFTKAILVDDSFFPAYFMRALVRCKQLEYMKAEASVISNSGASSSLMDGKNSEQASVDYEIIRADLDAVIRIAPDFVYAYYNRGNVSASLNDYRSALADYNKALELNPSFGEAYYNRGLTQIYLGNNKQGVSDLSKAGELGIVSSYNILKRFTDNR